jgi:hypothetical protein
LEFHSNSRHLLPILDIFGHESVFDLRNLSPTTSCWPKQIDTGAAFFAWQPELERNATAFLASLAQRAKYHMQIWKIAHRSPELLNSSSVLW